MLRPIAFSLAGLMACLLCLELVLRALPVSTATMSGYHFDPELLTYPAHHEWTSSTGWDLRNPQRLRSNNWGFVSQQDFERNDRAVALIGDSYVESSMLDANKRPASQLEAFLGGRRPVYALGSPGTALLDHAQRIRFASENFEIRDFVIWLERGDARQALCGSGNVHSRCLDAGSLEPRIERLMPPSLLKRVVRHSAMAQYFAGQLKFSGSAFLAAMLTRQPPDEAAGRAAGDVSPERISSKAVGQARKVVDAVLDQFVVEAGPYLTGVTVFVVDGHRGGGQTDPDQDVFQRQHLIDGLRHRGFQVVDMEPVYSAHAAQSPLSLEVGPYDGHLNGLGVGLVMKHAAARIAQR